MAEPEMRVEEDGPYQVTGPLPLARTSKVKTEYGEPVGTPFRADRDRPDLPAVPVRKSANKPFCDDSHLEEPRVDVKERADHGPRSARAGSRGDGAVMRRRPFDALQAGFCKDRFTGVWQMLYVDVRTSGPGCSGWSSCVLRAGSHGRSRLMVSTKRSTNRGWSRRSERIVVGARRRQGRRR